MLKLMEKVDVFQKLSLFNDYWNPRIVGELNGQCVKLAKFKGEFVWHKHNTEDELFYVLDGVLTIEFRDRTVTLNPNQLIVVPKGVEHRPVAEQEVLVMLFEPSATLNTGNAQSDLTRINLEKI
ncbi:MAG TPA: cupin domain-containing protein [Tenuifilaceae bacterium]|nr:cupin domain-containing protein [Tenuifilaceae bacterium]HQB78730.1 cupin domain-containing protein [Tenuifilaceae bacterium]